MTHELVRRRDWDSEHFGLEVWEAPGWPGPAAVSEAKTRGARLLLWRGDPNVTQFKHLVDGGFQLADDMAELRASRDGLLTELQELAHYDLAAGSLMLDEAVFPHSRFETIPAFAERGGSLGCYRHYLTQTAVVTPDGLAAWKAKDSSAEVTLLYVRPERRGKGWAAALLGHALADMRMAGYETVRATTWLQERAALAVYRNAGFRAVRRLQTWWLDL